MYHKIEETFIFDPVAEYDAYTALEEELNKHDIQYKKSITTTAVVYVVGSKTLGGTFSKLN